MLLNIVIVSYNVRNPLSASLDAITPLVRDGVADLWVVDNASRDDSADWIADRYPEAHLIRNTRNRGFAAAANQGIAASSGEFALLLNPDLVVTSSTVRDMLAFMDQHPSCGIAGARLIHPDGAPQISAHAFPSPGRWMAESLFPNRAVRRPPVSGPVRVDAVPGACMMVRRQMVEETGLLDERFFLYSEDVDWCLRACRAGWEVYLLPDIKAIHHLSQSSADRPDAGFVALYHSRDIYMRKHFSVWNRYMGHIALFVGVVLRTSLWGVWRLLPGGRNTEATGKFAQNRETLRWYLGGRPAPCYLDAPPPFHTPS
ncbi:MAG: glycosyltransferase family 2 protein [candidate division Zixibacteria bacterium]|nr:glycosyltransferase family 2 protein [candidate division Zixibacteria bacterium]